MGIVIFKRHFPELDIELSATFEELQNQKVIAAFQRLLIDDADTLVKNL